MANFPDHPPSKPTTPTIIPTATHTSREASAPTEPPLLGPRRNADDRSSSDLPPGRPIMGPHTGHTDHVRVEEPAQPSIAGSLTPAAAYRQARIQIDADIMQALNGVHLENTPPSKPTTPTIIPTATHRSREASAPTEPPSLGPRRNADNFTPDRSSSSDLPDGSPIMGPHTGHTDHVRVEEPAQPSIAGSLTPAAAYRQARIQVDADIMQALNGVHLENTHQPSSPSSTPSSTPPSPHNQPSKSRE